jgi:hypothetical protein
VRTATKITSRKSSVQNPGFPGGFLGGRGVIHAAARQKIESQRRTILEGSQEWDTLYRKNYNEEVKKLGI